MLNPEWFQAIDHRISRRSFTGEPVPQDSAEQLRAFCKRFRPFDDVRAEFVEHAPEHLFTGLVGSYGRIHGAPSAALFIGRPHADIDIGYVGEALVLDATRLGLETCWIAGAFSRKMADQLCDLSDDEHVRAISAVGIAEKDQPLGERTMRALARASTRLPLEKIAPGIDGFWPEWAIAAVEAVQKAPSGGNRQPWRFRFENEALVVRQAPTVYWTARMDIGIAMLHAELGAQHTGVRGRWERLDGADDARFVAEALAADAAD